MRSIFLIPVLLLLSIATFAQFKVIGQGTVFEEPESGIAKIIQMKNGFTFFFLLTKDDGIDIKIYNEKYKQKATKHLSPKLGKLNGYSVDGIFEVNGDIVALITDKKDRILTLFRLIIDGKTGVLKSEETVAELKKYNITQGYAMLFGGVPLPEFYVRKDQNSDSYAVAMLNSFETDRNKRIAVILFDGNNKEISRAYYASPEDKFKYMKYVDMAVVGGDKVSILAYGYNTRASGGKESELILGTLNKGDTTMGFDELNFSKDEVANGLVRYNPVTKKLVLIITAKASKHSYECSLLFIDPIKHTLVDGGILFPDDASKKSIELFGRKSDYTGLPQNLYVNSNGSFSVVFEEVENQTYVSKNATSISSVLGNIAVSTYSADGNETNSYLIPKSHHVYDAHTESFYLSKREGEGQLLREGNQFKSFAYLNGDDKTYILFNDLEKNTERVKKGNVSTVKAVSDCDAFFYRVDGAETMPGRSMVFTSPADKENDNNIALFAISDYNKERNIFVTLKLEKQGRDKNVRLVWMQP